MPKRPNVRSIAAGAPFLDIVVDAILDGTLLPGFDPRQDPMALAAATLYLPTRRSIRAIREVFLARLGKDAVILPRLLPLGEIDEDEAALIAAPDILLPEAVGALPRQIGLTRLILAWSRTMKGALLPVDGEDEPLLIPSSPGDAASLAADLAQFVDGMQVDGVSFEALGALTAEHSGRYDRYWDLTLRFLEIATSAWPRHLAERGMIDPIERRNLLLGLEAKRLRERPDASPVIVAGSTGSVPATRELIAAVAASPRGAVVLPGLDLDGDEAGWAAISDSGATHPQASLKALLTALGLSRGEVAPLGGTSETQRDRAVLISDALRPADTTDLWARPHGLPAERFDSAFASVAVIEAADEGEEALSIAIALREALEHAGSRAALVTPDRGLAARVVAELARWGIAADDSAGRPLPGTPPGIFARLVLDVAIHDFAPVPVLALLKHPFATFGLPRGEVRRATEALEIGALRGPRPPAGIAGLRKALAFGQASLAAAHPHPARRRLQDSAWLAAGDLIDRLEQALAPFAALWQGRAEQPASALFAHHRGAVEAAARGCAELYAQETGLALRDFLDELATTDPGDLALPPVEYPGLFAALAAARTVRGGEPRHPRLAIYGLLEARLLDLDRVVIGGLDEGTWPAEAVPDPWLNRPMRAAIGLSPPEKRIGLAAHDFAQSLAARDVVVTRAVKRGGSPTVASRWLQRLEARLGDGFAAMVARGDVYRALSRSLDAPHGPIVVPEAPRPCPPLALRPARLSVTRIEDLVRDPYSVYARSILRLEPLEPIGVAPGAADRGTIIHEAVRRFAALCDEGVPADAEEQLLAIGDALFAELADYPDVRAFWRPRFAEIARFLVGWEATRRPALAAVATETAGQLSWATAAGRVFTLTARADRLESDREGRLCAIDFKTGRAPTASQIRAGLNPQLALEAAILLESGFPGISSPALADPVIVKLSSGRAGCKSTVIRFDDDDIVSVAQRSLGRLKGLIDRFEDEATPYASLLHPMFKDRRSEAYDHLARIREWSLMSEAGEDAP